MSEQNTPISSINTDEPDRLYRTLKSRVVIGLFVTSLLIGGLLSYLAHLSEHHHTEQELELQVKLITSAIGSEINSIKALGRQLASRSHAREELERYQRGEIDRQQLVRLSSYVLTDALHQSQEIIGVTRLVMNDEPLVTIGENVPEHAWPERHAAAEQQIGIPFELRAQRVLTVSTPIISHEGERLGTDIVLYNVNSLYSITRKILTERKNTGHTLLASMSVEPPSILFSIGDRNIGIGHELLLSDLSDSARANKNYVRMSSRHLESAAFPVIGTDMLFVYSIDHSAFHHAALLHALYTGATALSLALVGSLLIFILVRPLAGRISVETDSLLALINENKTLVDTSARNASLLQSIADNSSSAIYMKDLEGRYLLMNKQTQDILNLGDTDYIGKTDFDLLPKNIASQLAENDKQIIETRQNLAVDEQVPVAGQLHDFMSIKFPLYDSNGELYGICGISTDITERKLAQRELAVSNERLEFAMMASNDGLWDWNVVTDEIFYSPRCKTMLGYEDEELSNKYDTWKNLINSEDRSKTIQLVQDCIDGKADNFKTESRMRHKDGHTVYVLVQGLLVRDETQTPIRFVGTHTDISELREQQILLTGDKEKLEQLVKERTIELEEITDYNRTLFIKSPIGLALCNLDGILVDVNPAYLDIIGYTEAEAKTLSYWQVTPRDYLGQEQEQQHVLETTGHYGPYEKEYLHKDGHRVPVRLNGLIIDMQGESLIWSTVEDITVRKQIENALIESEANLANAQAIAHLGSWSFDIGQHLMSWSDETCRIFDLPPGTKVSLDRFGDFLHPDDRLLVRSAWLAALKGAPFDIEHRIIVDGEEKWLRQQAILSFNEEHWATKAIGTVQDITEIKHAELATQEALQAATLLANTRSEFLANMSHEIRTPLNALLGLAKIGKRGDAPERSHELFDLITDSSERLCRVVNDILDFSRIEAGKLVIENKPFSIRRSVDNITRLIHNQVEDKALKLDVDIAHNVAEWHNGDALRVEQILLNLLSNAIKFTEDGGVSLKVMTYGDEVRFEVADTGIGMSNEHLESLYDPFEQGDSTTTRRFGGSGLGLSICKQLSSLMDGRLDAYSELGTGSKFTLSLPLAVTSELQIPLSSTSNNETRRLQGKHILAAEDIEVNRLVLFDLLEQEGANVVFANNGQQVVECFRHQDMPFDIVLMDIQMPEMDGYEATRQILSIDPDIPVIGLTAHALTEERKRCMEAGMVDHIAKPIDADLLVSAMIRNMKARSSGQTSEMPEPNPSSNGNQTMNKVIDEEALQKRYGGRDAMIIKLSKTFLRTHSNTSDKIREAIKQEDFESLRNMAHSIKGLSGYLEATELLRVSEHAQLMTESHDSKALEACIELANALDRVVDALSHRV